MDCEEELRQLGDRYPEQRVKAAKWLFQDGRDLDALLMIARTSSDAHCAQNAKRILALRIADTL